MQEGRKKRQGEIEGESSTTVFMRQTMQSKWKSFQYNRQVARFSTQFLEFLRIHPLLLCLFPIPFLSPPPLPARLGATACLEDGSCPYVP